MARRRRATSRSDDTFTVLVFVGLAWIVAGTIAWGAIQSVVTGAYMSPETVRWAWVALIVFLTPIAYLARKPVAVAWRWWRRRRAEQARKPGSPVASSREPIPAGLRFAVLRRDGFRCAYCGRGEPERVKLHIDHLVPVARGGQTVLENLVTACQDCNLGKSASDLVGADHAHDLTSM